MSQIAVVRKSDGKVALVHYMPMPKTADIIVNGVKKTYAFPYQNHVCLAWVDQADAPAVLAIKKTCCGGHQRPVFQYANRQQVNIHETGDPRKDFEANETNP